MIDGKLHEFADNVINRGRIGFGDVRRLQRSYLPAGIANGEELELLISLNAKLDRVDKAWAEWLVSAVRDFVVTRQGCEQRAEDAGKWVERLAAGYASASKLGRRVARQLRRELSQLRTVQSKSADQAVPVWDEAVSVIDVPVMSPCAPAQHSAA